MLTQTKTDRDFHYDRALATHVRLPLVYLAAAYTHPDPVENTHDICRIADALLDAGFIPLVPHLTLLCHIVSPKPYGRWLEYDRHLLARCDAVLRVPGYSNGATEETRFADSLGIPVIRPASSRPADCVAAVTDWFGHKGDGGEVSVFCHECEADADGCCDCGRCHVCCRCGPGAH